MEFKEKSKEPFFSSQTLGKIILFFVLIFSCAVVQTSFFGAAGIFPATPDLLLAAVIGIAVFDGDKSAAVAGIAAGVLGDALGGNGITFLPVLYLFAGYTYGILSRVFLKKNFLSWMVYMLIAAFGRGVFSFAHLMISEPSLNLFSAFTHILIPEYFMTVAFSVPLFFFSRICARPFHKQMDLD